MTRLLIINADDLGYDPAVSSGILEAMRRGVVSSATLMVNTPHSEAAAASARGLAIGLHLNLARHPPLSAAFPPALLRQGELDEARAHQLPAEVVEAETRAQLSRLEALLGARATHVDVHKHLHRHPQVLEGLTRAAAALDLPVRSIDPSMRRALAGRGVRTNDHFLGDAGADAYWTLERLTAELAALPLEGAIELMCHPGHLPTHVKSGYAAQREVELQTFLDPRARALLGGKKVPVGSFADLPARIRK